jgi:hypothetical protein
MTAPPRIPAAARARTVHRPPVDRTALDRTAVQHTVTNRPAPDPADSPEQKFSLSATQVLASMTAAVTAALVGSRLGVAGTVIGAGLASVISVIGGAVIGHSILLTRKQVKRAVLQVRGAGDGPADDRTLVISADDRTTVIPAADYTTVIPAVTRLDLRRASQDARTGPGNAEPGRPRPTRPSRPRVSTGVLLGIAASLAIFVSALGAVTVFETVKGSPLSGGDSGGLSVLGGNGGNPVEAPVTTTAVVTESSTVTQTVTSEVTAPATSTQSPSTQSSAPTTASSPAPVSSSAISSQAAGSADATPAAGPGPIASSAAVPGSARPR